MKEETKNEMSRETKLAFTQLYLETCRRALEVRPDCQMTNGRKGKAEEFLMNYRQLQDYVDRVFKHTLEHLGEKTNKSN